MRLALLPHLAMRSPAVAVLSFLLISLLAAWSLSPGGPFLPADHEGHTPVPVVAAKADDLYDRFRIDRVLSKQYLGPRLLWEMTAAEVVHKKRRNAIFTYQNLKEVVFRGLQIDFYAGSLNKATEGSTMKLSPELLLVGFGVGEELFSPDALQRSLDNAPLMDDAFAKVPDILTRVSVEDFSLVYHLASGKVSRLSAAGAKINTNIDYVMLDGNIELISALGSSLTAPKAVWSSRHGGVYVPAVPYSFNGKPGVGPAFFCVSLDGAIRKGITVPAIETVDVIEEKENKLIERLTSNAPFILKGMLGAAKGLPVPP